MCKKSQQLNNNRYQKISNKLKRAEEKAKRIMQLPYLVLWLITFPMTRVQCFLQPTVRTYSRNGRSNQLYHLKKHNIRRFAPLSSSLKPLEQTSEASIFIDRTVCEYSQVELPNGTNMEVISSSRSQSSSQSNQPFWSPLSFFDKDKNTNESKNKATKGKKPTLVFIHGSFHSAWCWAVHYMPYFSSKGYDCKAISLRGTQGTFAGEGVTKVPIMNHVDDIKSYLSILEKENNLSSSTSNSDKPVLITHSFGGLAVMKYLETHLDEEISGAALFCSVPPSGNGKMTMRFLFSSLKNSWKITKGFAMKSVIVDQSLLSELFFSYPGNPTGGFSEKQLRDVQVRFEKDTKATIDLGDLASKLPSKETRKDDGNAMFLQTIEKKLPFLVCHAKHDFIVDWEGSIETARYFGLMGDESEREGVEGITVVDSPHDIMLGPNWRNGANALLDWLETKVANV